MLLVLHLPLLADVSYMSSSCCTALQAHLPSAFPPGVAGPAARKGGGGVGRVGPVCGTTTLNCSSEHVTQASVQALPWHWADQPDQCGLFVEQITTRP